MSKIRRLGKITGDVPGIYKATTIYKMCVMINALVDRVNFICDFIETLHPEVFQEVENGK